MIVERMAYSPMEAASSLGLCLNSIYKMLKRGQLRGVKIDRKILIPKSELERLLSGKPKAPDETVQ
ncbi:MAG: helix-turn-helix domain-containing protein [Dehalococcoidales bacterium]|jgi:excisionase family DNA binding protein